LWQRKKGVDPLHDRSNNLNPRILIRESGPDAAIATTSSLNLR